MTNQPVKPGNPFQKDEVDKRIDKAIAFIISKQKKDGSIYDRENHTTMTSLALMAMAAVGHQPVNPNDEGEAMQRALDFVLQEDRQSETGYYGSKDGSRMYGHGITTLTLSEMLGMGLDEEQDQKIRKRTQKAIDLILRSQKVPKSPSHQGGWRYSPDSRDADLSATIWQLMSLRSAKNAGLSVPSAAIEDAIGYLERSYWSSLDSKGEPVNKKSGFAYQPGGHPEYTTTAAGLLAMQVCGEYESPFVKGAADWLLENEPNTKQEVLLLRHLLLFPSHVPKRRRPCQGGSRKSRGNPQEAAKGKRFVARLRIGGKRGGDILHHHGRSRLGGQVSLPSHLPKVEVRPSGPSVQPVLPDRVAPLDCLALVLRQGRYELPAEFDPRLVINRQAGDRPIGTEHQPVGAKGLQGNVHVGQQRIESPFRPVCLGRHARKLAADVFPTGHFEHLLFPWLHEAVAYPRLGDMVENQRQIRMKIDEFDRRRKLPLIDQDVVNQVELLELSNTLVEGLTQYETVIRLVLNHVPHP